MSHTGLTDNLTFVSALQMLRRLVAENLLTETEAERTLQELERRLRPTLLMP